MTGAVIRVSLFRVLYLVISIKCSRLVVSATFVRLVLALISVHSSGLISCWTSSIDGHSFAGFMSHVVPFYHTSDLVANVSASSPRVIRSSGLDVDEQYLHECLIVMLVIAWTRFWMNCCLEGLVENIHESTIFESLQSVT